MPAKPLSREVAQEALNWVEQYGSIQYASKAVGVPNGTIRHRYDVAQLMGLKPTVSRIEKPVRTHERLGRTHLVIPDIQARDGVPLEHMGWIGNYIVEKQPDVIVQIGDFADMPSLNSHGKPKHQEMQRYLKDVAAVHRAQEMLLAPIEAYNRTAAVKYQPRRVITKGNHEFRIQRVVDENPWLEGKVSEHDLGFEEHGWEVHDFLKVVEIDGIEYSHYFITGNKGNPCSTAQALLKARSRSATMGHTQYYDMAVHRNTLQRALFCGVCYLHDEDYLTPQGNNVRRQIVMKHEVHDGRYDLMEVSLNFLKKRYS